MSHSNELSLGSSTYVSCEPTQQPGSLFQLTWQKCLNMIYCTGHAVSACRFVEPSFFDMQDPNFRMKVAYLRLDDGRMPVSAMPHAMFDGDRIILDNDDSQSYRFKNPMQYSRPLAIPLVPTVPSQQDPQEKIPIDVALEFVQIPGFAKAAGVDIPPLAEAVIKAQKEVHGYMRDMAKATLRKQGCVLLVKDLIVIVELRPTGIHASLNTSLHILQPETPND